MSERPLVSIIISFLNGERFIRAAIESVVTQTYRSWELLLVDDGSSDGSTEIALRYAERDPDRVRYLEHDGHVNRGVCASRNLAAGVARGSYVALLDADDVWRPNKLERQVDLLESHPRAAMVFGMSQYWFSWTGDPADADRDYIPSLGVQGDTLYEPGSLLPLLYPLGEGSAPCPSNWLMRRDLIQEVGGFEEEFTGPFQVYEDQAFLIKVYVNAPLLVSSECWDLYRIHPESCVSVVKATGQYDSARSFFLGWLETYLGEHRVTDGRVWAALQNALRPYGRSIPTEQMADVDTRELIWSLRFAGDNVATVVLPKDTNVVRVTISRAGTETTHDIQLNQRHLSLTAGRGYLVRFRGRADGPRSISFGVAQAHSPWTNLGLFAKVDLTTGWQAFEAKFTASEDDGNARVHFDLGGSELAVELEEVALIDVQKGQPVDPGLASIGSGVPDRHAAEPEPPVPFGKVELGSLRRLTPISRDWGWDRGLPIDRYYIERFLSENAADIRGRVLEIGDDSYTLRFGGERVGHSDVLHVEEGNPRATIVADLSDAHHIPSSQFDCIILTQTLQFIFDVRSALATLYRILAPGGVLLATFPGISHQGHGEWSDSWYWSFTARSADRLFNEHFDAGEVTVQTHGNVLSATAFLHGLSAEELSREELERKDSGYQLLLTVRAVKPLAADTPVLRSRSRSRALLLMYHRVTELRPDPWNLCVKPDHFAEHLEVLRARTRVDSLTGLVESLERGALADQSVVVTFDDGYADNLHVAKPLLTRYEVPATFFLTSGYIGSDREFWWDELERLVFEPRTLPRTLRLEVGGTTRTWELGESAVWTDDDILRHRGWKAEDGAPTSRHRLFLDLYPLLKLLLEDERHAILGALREWGGVEPGARPTHRPLSREEATRLAEGGLVDIGAHTVTHPVLARLSVGQQREELVKGRADLEALLGRAVSTLAYPYGSSDVHTAETMRAVREAGFRCACTTASGLVRETTDQFLLPREMVLDWDGRQFSDRLSQWLNGAPSAWAVPR